LKKPWKKLLKKVIEENEMEPQLLRHELIEAFRIKTEQVGIQDRE
jgi:hypothetical protein